MVTGINYQAVDTEDSGPRQRRVRCRAQGRYVFPAE